MVKFEFALLREQTVVYLIQTEKWVLEKPALLHHGVDIIMNGLNTEKNQHGNSLDTYCRV